MRKSFFSHSTGNWVAAWTVALLAVLATAHVIVGPLVFTGDETRYVYASVSAWFGQGLSVSPEQWNAWLKSEGIEQGLDAHRGIHSVVHATLLSPVVATMGIEMGRWVQLFIVCAVAIPLLIASGGKHTIAFAVWTSLYMLSVPVLAYLKLLYAEAWLFLLLTVVLFYCSREKISSQGGLIAVCCLILLPFVHIRVALISAVFGVFLFYKMWRDRGRIDGTLIKMATLVIVALPLFAWYQILISGDVGGSASVAAMPSLDRFVKLSATQLFGYRHGLVYYNPLSLIGIAGLFLGVVRRDDFLTACALAFLAYVALIVWGTASESYAGRFWVAVVPLLIFGSVYWFRNVDSRLRWFVVIPLGLLTLFNGALFVVEPVAYLENRFAAVPYEFLQEVVCECLDFGLIAAPDPFESGKIVLRGNYDAKIFLILVGFIGCLVAMGSTRLKRAITFTTLAVMIVLFAVHKSFINPISPELYALQRGVDDNGNTFLRVDTQDREMISGFKIGKYADNLLWGLDDFAPREFVVTGQDPDGRPYPEQRISGYQLSKLIRPQRYSTLTITAVKPTVTNRWNQLPITLF